MNTKDLFDFIWLTLTCLITFIFSDIDECVSAPCQNGGTCTDQVNSYVCQCAPGYTDLQCQTGKDASRQNV